MLEAVFPRKVVVNPQRNPKGVPELVVRLVEPKPLQPMQDVVDGGQVHDRVNGMQDPLPVVLFLLRNQLKRREHGADHEPNVPVVHLRKKGKNVNTRAFKMFWNVHSTWWFRWKKLPPI